MILPQDILPQDILPSLDDNLGEDILATCGLPLPPGTLSSGKVAHAVRAAKKCLSCASILLFEL